MFESLWDGISMHPILFPICMLAMVGLIIGWSICLYGPFWEILALWRSSRMPIVEPEPTSLAFTSLTEAQQFQAVEAAKYLLLGAMGGTKGIGGLTYGLFGHEDSAQPGLRVCQDVLEAQRLLAMARVDIGVDLSTDVPALHDPINQAYVNKNFGPWFVCLIGPRFLLAGLRFTSMRAPANQLKATTRELLDAVEAHYEKLKKPAPTAHIKLADRIPMVA